MFRYQYKEDIRSERFWGVLLAVYCTCLIISNVLAAKVFALGPFTLPCAVIIFPVVYILNDMMAELFPLVKVRKGILIAFALNLLAVICYEIAIILPGYGENVFATVLGSSWRVLIASFLAYLVGSNVNAWIMNVLHAHNGDDKLFIRCIASTIIGEFLDAIIFISIAFYGTMSVNALITMILAQAVFKTLYEIVVFPITRVIIKNVKYKLN